MLAGPPARSDRSGTTLPNWRIVGLTCIANPTFPGDEVMGLTRGLLGAGCSAVVASLWTVSDESTARLMERFYANLQTGEPPAVALRSAMLAIREQYNHP